MVHLQFSWISEAGYQWSSGLALTYINGEIAVGPTVEKIAGTFSGWRVDENEW